MLCLQRAALRLSPLFRDRQKATGNPSPAGDLIAALAGMFLYLLFLLLTARPLSSLLLTLAVGVLLVSLNRVKEQILREPLVLVDVYLLPQVFRYPDLYFPFLPKTFLVVFFLGAALALVLLLCLEASPAFLRSPPGMCLVIAPLAAVLVLYLRMNKGGLARLNNVLLSACPVSHDAVKDAKVNGPLASALMHPLLAGKCRREGRDFLSAPDHRPTQSRWPEAFEREILQADLRADNASNDRLTASKACLRPFGGKDLSQSLQSISSVKCSRADNASYGCLTASKACQHPDHAPHVVLLQAESFFDVRQHLSEAARERLGDFLPNWDALVREKRILPTPDSAFGAYTMRTEFEALTGLGASALGPWAFNPYTLAASRPMWSLARHFKGLGYETLCLHPYHKGFFSRQKVIPNLGFDCFLSLDDLSGLPHFGPHTSDLALGEDILRRLEASSSPLFCFVVTMEAHGPWLPGRLRPSELQETLGDIDYSFFDESMQLYLCHLRRMDHLFGLFRSWNTEGGDGKRQCILWAYGDHAPALRVVP